MRLQITARHGYVNDSVRRYVERKVEKLGRRLHEATLVEVVLDRERNRKIVDDHVVEVEIHTKGSNLHGREASSTYEAAVDLLVDKLGRQITRYRDKRVHERRRQGTPREALQPPASDESGSSELEESAA
jgi:putative sigma-54 modulation protein